MSRPDTRADNMISFILWMIVVIMVLYLLFGCRGIGYGSGLEPLCGEVEGLDGCDTDPILKYEKEF